VPAIALAAPKSARANQILARFSKKKKEKKRKTTEASQ
jgi:hypothetical protein